MTDQERIAKFRVFSAEIADDTLGLPDMNMGKTDEAVLAILRRLEARMGQARFKQFEDQVLRMEVNN